MDQESAIELTLGVNVVAGALWFFGVDAEFGHVEDGEDRLQVDYDMLGEGRALSELEEGVEDLLRRRNPVNIALLDAGTSSQARSVAVSHRRGQVEAVVLIAAERVGVPVERVTHAAVKKVFGVAPTKREIRQTIEGKLALAAPKNWTNLAPAAAAALVATGLEPLDE